MNNTLLEMLRNVFWILLSILLMFFFVFLWSCHSNAWRKFIFYVYPVILGALLSFPNFIIGIYFFFFWYFENIWECFFGLTWNSLYRQKYSQVSSPVSVTILTFYASNMPKKIISTYTIGVYFHASWEILFYLQNMFYELFCASFTENSYYLLNKNPVSMLLYMWEWLIIQNK